MKTIEKQRITVRHFDNIECPGCHQPAAISTKMGQSVTCPCGVVNTPIGVIVESEGTCDETAHERKADADRAERAKARAKEAAEEGSK